MGGYSSIPLSGIYPQIQTGMQAAQGAANLGISQQQRQALAMQNQITQIQLQNAQIGQQAWRNVMNPAGPSDGTADGSGAPATAAPTTAVTPGGAAALPQGNAPVPLATALQPTPSMLAPGATSLAGPQAPMAQAVPLAQAGANPSMTQQPQAPTQQPAGQLQPRQAQPQVPATGVPMMDRWIAEMQRLGASPAAVMDAQTRVNEYMSKRAALTAEQLKNDAAMNDVAAGHIQGFAKQSDDYKQANWQDFRDQQVRSGAWTMAQAKSLGDAYPGDTAMMNAAQLHMTASQIDQEAERQGTAARGQGYAAEAALKQKQADYQLAAATFPSDPKDFAAWTTNKATTPSSVQAMVAGKTYAQAQAAIQRAAVPPADYDRMQQQDAAQAWDYVLKSAKAGRAQYNQAREKMAITNPSVASLLPEYGDDTVQRIQDMALSPQQASQADNKSDNRDLRASIAAQQAQQRDFMNSMRESDLNLRQQAFANKNNGLSPVQVSNQWNRLRNSDQQDYKTISNLQAEITSGKFLGATNNGEELSDQDKMAKQSQLTYAKSHLQESQMEKARLMGIDTVDPNQVPKNGQIDSSEPGMVWRENNGTVYIMSAPSTPPAPAVQPPPPPPPPGGTPPPPGGSTSVAPPPVPAPKPVGTTGANTPGAGAPPPPAAGKPNANPQNSSAPEPRVQRLGQQHGNPPGQAVTPPGGNQPPKTPTNNAPQSQGLSYGKRADGSYVISTPAGKFTAKDINQANAFLKAAGYQPIQ